MRRRWWMWVAGLFVVVLAGLGIAASALARRLEPFVREATARYLRERFEAEVEIGRLGASLPIASPMRVLRARGGQGPARFRSAPAPDVRSRTGAGDALRGDTDQRQASGYDLEPGKFRAVGRGGPVRHASGRRLHVRERQPRGLQGNRRHAF